MWKCRAPDPVITGTTTAASWSPVVAACTPVSASCLVRSSISLLVSLPTGSGRPLPLQEYTSIPRPCPAEGRIPLGAVATGFISCDVTSNLQWVGPADPLTLPKPPPSCPGSDRWVSVYTLRCQVGRHCIECHCDVQRCPTPCDDDCETNCHESHVVIWKRDHDPSECPSALDCHCGEAT